jgi:hypothetical protein
MTGKSPGHSHQFTIADREAVDALLAKLERPQGSRHVNSARLAHAMADAKRQFALADERDRQAFFHGLLTGYAVGLKCRNG